MGTENFTEKAPCIDIATGRLLLKYATKEESARAKDELWVQFKTSYKEGHCTKCKSWHLFDLSGLGLTGNQRLTYRQTHHRSPIGNLRGQEKCAFCKSSDGVPKTIFKDLIRAQQVIDSLTEPLGYPLWAYMCPHGNGVHLTKNMHKQSIGSVAQKFITQTTYEIVEVKAPPKAVAFTSPTLASSPLKKSYTEEKKIVCQFCGYKLNQDPKLLCAFCGKAGPYETV